MPDQYVLLTEDERDDVVVEFYAAQERDLFCHRLNRNRYAAMLATLKESDFRDRVVKLAAETDARIKEVEAIIAATLSQLPSGERLQAAADRIVAKRAAPLP
jgi:Flp pilus assembly CpaF family ATPase